jgi:hypothetical protein
MAKDLPARDNIDLRATYYRDMDAMIGLFVPVVLLVVVMVVMVMVVMVISIDGVKGVSG